MEWQTALDAAVHELPETLATTALLAGKQCHTAVDTAALLASKQWHTSFGDRRVSPFLRV